MLASVARDWCRVPINTSSPDGDYIKDSGTGDSSIASWQRVATPHHVTMPSSQPAAAKAACALGSAGQDKLAVPYLSEARSWAEGSIYQHACSELGLGPAETKVRVMLRQVAGSVTQ